MEIPENELLACAVTTARKAGDFARANRHRRTEVNKSATHDVKLQMDVETQQVADAVVLEHFPDHTILGEEDQTDQNSPYTWIIDPIDGTLNYARGMHHWCTSIAVQHQGEILAGCIYCPMYDELFTATKHGPALCNDEPIHISNTSDLREATALFGAGKPDEDASFDMRIFDTLINATRIARLLGAAAIDICSVAAGRADAYVDMGIYLWDFAAAGLIAERAGAQITCFPEMEPFQHAYLCTNGHLHKRLHALYDA
ncbi:MAG: myo-inositol-1(or 4)-monophosphatase [Kiritimatiellia bacterium]|jgi:myo-inositol-1(or 4)-monophosphatase